MALRNPLSELEQKVMNALWSRGSGSAAEVQAALMPERPLRDSTVRTILGRLEDKGYVTHVLDGRTFIYRPLEKPQHLAVRAVRQIIDRFCHGSVESLLLGMVDDEVLGPEELRRIAQRVARERKAKEHGAEGSGEE
jgi:BlaI family penicillinase repressor